jgi:hypothetical protein
MQYLLGMHLTSADNNVIERKRRQKNDSIAVLNSHSAATLSESLSYDTLEFHQVGNSSQYSFGKNVPSTGSLLLTAVGTNLAINNPTLRMRVGSSSCSRTQWESNTQLTALPASGLSYVLPVAVTSSKVVHSGSGAASYDAPAVSSSGPNNSPKVGSRMHTVSGKGHGDSPSLRFGVSGAEATLWASDTSTLCTSTSSSRASDHVIITAGRQFGSITEIVSFDAASVESYHSPGGNVLPISGTDMIFSSRHLGSYMISSAVQVGGSASESTSWISDSCLLGKVMAGHLHSRLIRVTSSNAHGGAHGSSTFAISYDSPAIFICTPSNRDIANVGSITMQGSGFRQVMNSLTTRIVGSAAEATAWASDTTMTLRPTVVSHYLQPGVTPVLVVTAGSVSSSLTDAFKYDQHILSSIRRANSASTGLETLSLYGNNFAVMPQTPASSFGQSSSEASVWVSDSSVLARASAGIFATLNAIMTISSIRSTITEIVSYHIPLVKAHAYNTRTTMSVEMFALIGNDICPSDHSVTAGVQYTAGEASVWFSHTTVNCLLAPGLGLTRKLSLTAGILTGTISETFSFETPLVSSTRRGNSATYGSFNDGANVITAFGSQLGAGDASPKIMMGFSNAEMTLWIAATALWCQVSGSLTASLQIRLTVGNRLSGTSSEMHSYDSSHIDSTQTANLNTMGGLQATILGSDFSLTLATGASGVGNSPCEASDWMSLTSIQCKTARGSANSHHIVVTTGLQVGSFSKPISYERLIVKSVTSQNVRYTGNVTMSITGVFYGTFDSSLGVHLMDTSTEVTEWINDYQIVCLLAKGLSGTGTVHVTSGDLVGSETETFTYNKISIFSTQNVSSNKLFGSTLSAIILEDRLPAAYHTVKASTGGTSCSMTIWLNYTAVLCRFPSELKGTHSLILTAGVASETLTETWTVDRFFVSALRSSNLASDQAGQLTVLGWAFLRSGSMMARFGQTAAEKSLWITTSSVRCKATRSSMSTVKMFVTVGSLAGSVSELLSFHAPSISSLSPSNILVGNDVFVTVTGKSRDQTYSTFPIRIGSSVCESTEWKGNFTSVICKVSRTGHDGSFALALTAGQQAGSLTQTLTFERSSLSSLVPSNVPAMISSPVILAGSGFESIEVSFRAALGLTACESTFWTSISSIRCRTTQSSQASLRSVLTAGSRAGSTTQAFSYDGASVRCLGNHANLPAATSVLVTILGASLGSQGFTLKATTGDSVCESTEWDGSNSVTCRVARTGHRDTMKLAVTVHLSHGIPGTVTDALSYNDPKIASISVKNIPVASPPILTLMGPGFERGPSLGYTFSTRPGSTSSERSVWQSSSSIWCRIPLISRSQGSVPFVVTSGMRVGSLSKVLSFDRGIILTLRPANIPPVENVTVSVFGTGIRFGHREASTNARWDSSTCESTSWSGDTWILCKVADVGGRGSISFVVTAGIVQRGTCSEALSYDLHWIKTSLYSKNSTDNSTEAFHLISNQGSSSHHILLLSHALTSSSPTANLGTTACESTHWISFSSLSCKAPIGRDSSSGIKITMGSRQASASSSYSYDIRVVSGLSPSNFKVLDNAVSQIHGVLDPSFASSYVRMSKTAAEMTSWISITSLKCMLGRGLGFSQGLTLTSGLRSGTISQTFSYAHASASGMTMNLPATGSVLITVMGSAFPTWSTSAAARVGGTVAEHSIWLSESKILCRSGAGVGIQLRTVISVYVASVSTVSDTFTYDRPKLQSVYPLNGPNIGFLSLTISGMGFGNADYSPRARVGETTCKSVTYISETSLVCSSPRGTGALHAVSATVSGQATAVPSRCSMCVGGNRDGLACFIDDDCNSNGLGGCLAAGTPCVTELPQPPETLKCSDNSSHACFSGDDCVSRKCSTCNSSYCWPVYAFCYDSPKTDSLVPQFGSTTGRFSLTIVGANFDLENHTADAMFGDTSSMITYYVSDTSVMGMVAPGAGANLETRLTILGYNQLFEDRFSYLSPIVSSLNKTNSPSTGLGQVVIFGGEFAISDYSVRARLGSTGCEGTVWTSFSSVISRCDGHQGIGMSQQVVVSVVLQQGTKDTVLTFDAHSIAYSARSDAASTGANLPTTGRVDILVTGHALGPYSSSLLSRIVGTSSEATSWSSDSSVIARSHHGVDRNIGIVLTVIQRIATVSESFTFDAVQISKSVLANEPLLSTHLLTALGSSFGQNSNSPATRILKGSQQDQGCEATQWISDSSLALLPPWGSVDLSLGERSIVATVVQRFGTLSDAVSYDSGVIFDVEAPVNGPKTGMLGIVIVGLNWGLYDYTLHARLGWTACEATSWQSTSSIGCRAPAGTDDVSDVVLTIHAALGSSSKTTAFTFDVHSLYQVQQTNAPKIALSGLDVTIKGKDFSTWTPSPATSRVGGTSCFSTQWISDSTLMSKPSEGQHLFTSFIVTIGSGTKTLSNAFTYNIPSLSSVGVGAGCTTCEFVTMSGGNMAGTSATAQARLGGLSCEATLWTSDSVVSCLYASLRSGGDMQPTDNGAVVTVWAHTGSLTKMITYEHPLISSLRITNAVTAGGSSLTISGSRFGSGLNFLTGLELGSADFTAMARVGLTSCRATRWLSDSSVHANLARGVFPCTPHVHLIYTSLYTSYTPPCTSHVHLMYTSLYTSCTPHVHLMYTSCTPHVHLMYT